MFIGHSNVHSSNGRTEISIGHKYMSTSPLDEQKCPLDIQMSIRPYDEWTLSNGDHFSLLFTWGQTQSDYVITASLHCNINKCPFVHWTNRNVHWTFICPFVHWTNRNVHWTFKCPFVHWTNRNVHWTFKCPFVHWTFKCLFVHWTNRNVHWTFKSPFVQWTNRNVHWTFKCPFVQWTNRNVHWTFKCPFVHWANRNAIGHSNVHSSIGPREMSIGHQYMSIRPLDKQKCPLDIQMSIRPLDEQKCPLDIQMSIRPLDKQNIRHSNVHSSNGRMDTF